MIRVLNLWQKNQVFNPEVIQPLFDLADPNHPIHKEQGVVQSNGVNQGVVKGSPALQRSPQKNVTYPAEALLAANVINTVSSFDITLFFIEASGV